MILVPVKTTSTHFSAIFLLECEGERVYLLNTGIRAIEFVCFSNMKFQSKRIKRKHYEFD